MIIMVTFNHKAIFKQKMIMKYSNLMLLFLLMNGINSFQNEKKKFTEKTIYPNNILPNRILIFFLGLETENFFSDFAFCSFGYRYLFF